MGAGEQGHGLACWTRLWLMPGDWEVLGFPGETCGLWVLVRAKVRLPCREMFKDTGRAGDVSSLQTAGL